MSITLNDIIFPSMVDNVFEYLKAPIKRVTLPDTPAPASRVLERVYYPNESDIMQAVREVIENAL